MRRVLVMMLRIVGVFAVAVIGLIVAMLGARTYREWPSRPTEDERAVLAAAKAEALLPAYPSDYICLDSPTQPPRHGGTYAEAWSSSSAYSRNQLDELDSASRGRPVRLSLDSTPPPIQWWNSFLNDSCQHRITIDTPRFIGAFAFVSLKHRYALGYNRFSNSQVMAWQRSSSGWRPIGGTGMQSDGPIF